MGFLNKLKDLFTDVEEVEEEVEVEEEEKNVLPKVMRQAVLEEEKKHEEDEVEIKQIPPVKKEDDVKPITLETREHRFNFSHDIEKQTSLPKENIKSTLTEEKPKKVADLYQDDSKDKNHFKVSPVISPVYGVLGENYKKDEVMEKDDSANDLKRPSKKVDFESVRKKAFGNLSDEIKDNLLCENCELLKEAKRVASLREDDLLYDISKEAEEADAKKMTIEKAIENYEDFGVAYEPPKDVEVKNDVDSEATIENNEEVNNDVKIVNHNDGEVKAEQIEVKEDVKTDKKKDDLFELIDSMYEEKGD